MQPPVHSIIECVLPRFVMEEGSNRFLNLKVHPPLRLCSDPAHMGDQIRAEGDDDLILFVWREAGAHAVVEERLQEGGREAVVGCPCRAPCWVRHVFLVARVRPHPALFERVEIPVEMTRMA